MSFVAAQPATAQQSTSTAGSTESVVCGIHYGKPGHTLLTSDGVRVTNDAKPGGPWIRVWTLLPDGSQPERSWVTVPSRPGDDSRRQHRRHGHGHGQRPRRGQHQCDNFDDQSPATRSTVAPGGIHVVGDNATVNITGSGNDVDFQSDTKHGKVDIAPGGSGNDIDLHRTTTNAVSPAAGQHLHN